MAQELAFAAPRTEEMTKTGIGVGVGFATGLVQGAVAKFAPQFGELAKYLTWGSLLVTPVVGVAGALFTRGMVSDALLGVATGSSGVLGYSVLGLLPEMGLAKKAQGQLTAEQRAALAAGNKVKQLPAGAAYAPQRQQAAAKSSLEF